MEGADGGKIEPTTQRLNRLPSDAKKEKAFDKTAI